MSARYTRGDGIKTAITALIVGMAAGAFYALPAVVTVPVLCAFLYWCGVMDGRANRRGGRAVEYARQVRANLAALGRRPAGDRS